MIRLIFVNAHNVIYCLNNKKCVFSVNSAFQFCGFCKSADYIVCMNSFILILLRVLHHSNEFIGQKNEFIGQ